MQIKELLRQYRTLDAEIKDIRGRSLTEPELADIFDKELQDMLETRRKIEKYIADIPDSLIRYIFRCRYIDAMKWEEIAIKLTIEGKGTYSPDMVRKAHDKYMKKAPEV